MFHKLQGPGEIHTTTQWVVADATARNALTVIADDIGKICLQLDSAIPYMLTKLGPTVWQPLGVDSPFPNPMTTLKDIIIGGTVTAGVAAPVRLGKGGLRQVLRVNYANNDLEYGDDSTVSVIPAPVSGVLTVDLSLGDYFTHAITANITSWNFINALGAGRGMSKMIRITQDATAKTVAWPSSFRWDGTAPVVSVTGGAVDVLAITSFDNMTKWDATLSKGRV